MNYGIILLLVLLLVLIIYKFKWGEIKMNKNNVGLKMKYFVLKPYGTDAYAIASRQAIMEYSRSIEKTNEQLATDLRVWVVDCKLESDGKSSYKDYWGGE